MTYNTAILLATVAKEPPVKIPPEYGAMLVRLWRETLGMSDVEFGRRAGIRVGKQGDQNVNRLMNGGAVSLAHKAWKALDAMGVKVPPLVVDATEKQRRWMEVGEALHDLAPAEFATELAAHEERVSTLRKVAAARAASVTDLEATEDPALFRAYNERKTEPLRMDRAADDRGPVYSPKPDGQEDEGKVGRSRKPPRSVGR